MGKIDMGDRTSIRCRWEFRCTISHIILDIDMGYGLMIWEMTVSIWPSWSSRWEILSPYQHGVEQALQHGLRHLPVHVVAAQVEIESKV